MQNCDLHCHSTASDGLLSPEAVVRRAAANGVDLLALTDHDGLAGLAEAAQAAEEAGIRFLPGVEVSIVWQGVPIHIVGLNFRPETPILVAGLDDLSNGRLERGRRMAAALEALGLENAFAGALKYAGNPRLLSRAHFARYLVEKGYARDVRAVFDNYLVPGKPGYVDHRWASLEEAVGWITGAGGVAVIAHPGRYKLSTRAMKRFIEEFQAVGGQAVEVVSGSHSPEEAARFARIAKQFGLHASRGSDFHGPDESYADLGRLPPLPDDLTPVWNLF